MLSNRTTALDNIVNESYFIIKGAACMEEKSNIFPKKTQIDVIDKEKMKFKVLNKYPEKDLKNSENIEKRLFEVFKKYEIKGYEKS